MNSNIRQQDCYQAFQAKGDGKRLDEALSLQMPPTSLGCGRQGCPGMLGRTVKEKQEADKVLAGTSCLKS